MYSRKKRAAKKLSLQSARTESGCLALKIFHQHKINKSTWSSLMPAFIWKNNVTGSCNMARVEKLHVVPDLLRIQLQDQF